VFSCVHSRITEFEQKVTKGTESIWSSSDSSFPSLPSVRWMVDEFGCGFAALVSLVYWPDGRARRPADLSAVASTKAEPRLTEDGSPSLRPAGVRLLHDSH
jgi:hypothetical protein